MSMRLATGHEVVPMSEEWMAEKPETRQIYHRGMVRIMPEGWLYPATAPHFLNKIQDFKFRAEDVLVVTFPKSGTTWMQEIAWTMLHNPDLDNPNAHESLLVRSPDISQEMTHDGKMIPKDQLEMFNKKLETLRPGSRVEDGVVMQLLEIMPGPRVIKSHYPITLFPPNLLDTTKVVYVARNPKDTVVSFYHFCRVIKVFNYQGSFDNFVEEFMNDGLTFGPYWPHLADAWRRRHHPNLLIVFYEDLQGNIMAELHKINKFLGTNLTQKQLENVAQQTAFSTMKSRGEPMEKGAFNKDLLKSSGGYIRKGVMGDWRNHMSPELNQEMDQWIQRHTAELGLSFKWDS